jgi:hypothetical protein
MGIIRHSRQPHPFSLPPPASLPTNQPTPSNPLLPTPHSISTKRKTGIIGQYPDRDRVPRKNPAASSHVNPLPFLFGEKPMRLRRNLRSVLGEPWVGSIQPHGLRRGCHHVLLNFVDFDSMRFRDYLWRKGSLGWSMSLLRCNKAVSGLREMD